VRLDVLGISRGTGLAFASAHRRDSVLIDGVQD
jgi:hypothetical protein